MEKRYDRSGDSTDFFKLNVYHKKHGGAVSATNLGSLLGSGRPSMHHRVCVWSMIQRDGSEITSLEHASEGRQDAKT